MPGCQLTLTQKRPSLIIRVGETELAFEAGIAREIFVKNVPQAVTPASNEETLSRA